MFLFRPTRHAFAVKLKSTEFLFLGNTITPLYGVLTIDLGKENMATKLGVKSGKCREKHIIQARSELFITVRTIHNSGVQKLTNE